MRITLLHSKLPRNCGICFGPRNRNVRRVMEHYTIAVCPFCQKPVNVAVKKKSSVGGAHKGKIFTDEYTQEPLYCTEKNHLGILKFPLLTWHKGSLYSNELTWEINAGLTRIFSIRAGFGAASMVITNKVTGAVMYTPVETAAECTNEHENCINCTKQ